MVKTRVKLATRLLSAKVVTPGVDVNRGRTSRVSGHSGVDTDAYKADAKPSLVGGETEARKDGLGTLPLEESVKKAPARDEAHTSADPKLGSPLVVVHGRDPIHDHAKTNGDHCIRVQNVQM